MGWQDKQRHGTFRRPACGATRRSEFGERGALRPYVHVGAPASRWMARLRAGRAPGELPASVMHGPTMGCWRILDAVLVLALP